MKTKPVPIRTTTEYTVEYGNLYLSTAEYRYQNGTILFQTSLIWDADQDNPFDPGITHLATTEDKNVAYNNHERFANTDLLIQVYIAVQRIKREVMK